MCCFLIQENRGTNRMYLTGLLGRLTEIVIEMNHQHRARGTASPLGMLAVPVAMEKWATGILIKVKELNILPFKYNQVVLKLDKRYLIFFSATPETTSHNYRNTKECLQN